MSNLYDSKKALNKKNVNDIKEEVIKQSWISLRQYFDGAGNGSEAKIAVVALGIAVKEQQADNNKRAVDLAYSKFSNNVKEIILDED